MSDTFTIEDNNRTVAAKVGRPIHITLSGNPTTGYTWTRFGFEGKDELSDAAMDVVVNYKASKSEPGMVGTGGAYDVTVTPKQRGMHMLELVYARPFEKSKKNSPTFNLRMDT
ncbi:inhibitor of cysteine peptidase (ICP) [Leptomonas seymouri]|uniref:Inhibitor of cysteine peptidase (ICP) n=1 Tax=Leptomonas seymouri TaxID=5684 RepID=A0A0N1HSR0_LEPSE|nr:inhibitor of cysteine peptidase (ICP) [Leptomonas seymouri]|eukprot:KPI82590.1 inhibitor of cysteine peptidase (ICP) [Leptomonas seymouri]